jgi:hypothetical protein
LIIGQTAERLVEYIQNGKKVENFDYDWCHHH